MFGIFKKKEIKKKVEYRTVKDLRCAQCKKFIKEANLWNNMFTTKSGRVILMHKECADNSDYKRVRIE